MDVYIEKYRELLKVCFYTIRFADEQSSETAQFVERFSQATKKKEQYDFGVIQRWLRIIGNERGADELLFRGERRADALPPPQEVGCRLRLYCIACSPSIVILGGGGIKPKQDRLAEISRDTAYHFEKINDVARILDSRIKMGRIRLEHKALQGDYQRLYLP
ncbi:hypothetical protein GKZ68_00300 [Hymenobacter sp. BRD128]|uniref:hypothetical protein n=1 Tax=Hymenobacter sp. BRD128 TaxID=2675878 RepID=UPI001565BB63|nr:hypothetical protein [Hymenobacter sp. BRD128]QKG55212.1 hypothetical protein GKZ68_00300 [Hymenobacter sp. BRD128]